MMAENLAEMVKNETLAPEVLDTPIEEVVAAPETPAIETPVVEEIPARSVTISTLPEWFTKYSEAGEVKAVKIAIKGVNTDNILIVSFPTGEKLEDESLVKDVELFKRANKIPALDLPASTVNIYSNSFRMIQEYEGVFIKVYGLKTNIILSFCINVNGLLIPFETSKVKRKEKYVVIPQPSQEILDKLAINLGKPADLEALELRYKQSKGVEGIATNLDAIKWLLDKQATIADINHHLQIDTVVTQVLA